MSELRISLATTATTSMSAAVPLSLLLAIVSYIPILLQLIATHSKKSDFISFALSRNNDGDGGIYDFIVVGGGSAGSVLASRLSEKYRVLLLEAGGDPTPVSNFPFTTLLLANQSQIDWQYQSCQPALNSLGHFEEKCHQVPRGKGLGGSSVINWMIYMRGSPEDFNNWARHTGDDRWSYANVERLFHKMEDYNGYWKDSGYHGVGGPMRIEPIRYAPSLEYFLDAGKELGYEIMDPNRNQTQGFCPMDVTQKRGTRFSTYRGYLKPILKRKNLVIHRYSLATKIRFDANMRAVGVEYLRHGVPKYAQVTKEIVISGGAINSPQLLMLSGIGPKAHLTQHQIPTLVDLPVGQNYQEHVSAIGGPFLFDKPVSHVTSRDVTWGAVRDYLQNGTGPFSRATNLIGYAFLSSSLAPKNWPDLAIVPSAMGPCKLFGRELDKHFAFPNNTMEKFYEKDEGKDGNIPIVFLGRPKSRGEILLKDSNPLSHPLINPFKRHGDHVDDIKRLIEGLQYTLKIYEGTETYAKLGSKLSSHHLPGCEQFELKSFSYWECVAKLTILETFHSSCTCPMGKIGDPNTVVDSQLRVLGTTGLRVADASIMPYITNANTNAPTIMIGEMCSEMILQDWNLQNDKVVSDRPLTI